MKAKKPSTHAHAHAHVYANHPNPDWQTHVACRICGFAIPRHLLRYAVEHGASYVEPAVPSCPATGEPADECGRIDAEDA